MATIVTIIVVLLIVGLFVSNVVTSVNNDGKRKYTEADMLPRSDAGSGFSGE